MKKILIPMILSLCATHAVAHQQGFQPSTGGYSSGGFNGPSNKQGLTTVAAVKEAGLFSDDTPVTLTGHITAAVGHEMYAFRDQTGTINVEIDDDIWHGLQVTPQTKVMIHGEIDRELNSVKVDVDFIRLAK